MAVWRTLMARATTVGPGGSARTACRSSSSHWRTTLSLADGGYWSKVYSGGGSGRSSGAGGGGVGGGRWGEGRRAGGRAGGRAGDRQGHGQDGQQDERQPLLHGPPTFLGG